MCPHRCGAGWVVPVLARFLCVPVTLQNERNAVISVICARVCAPKLFTAAKYDHPFMSDPGMRSAETRLRGAGAVAVRRMRGHSRAKEALAALGRHPEYLRNINPSDEH